MHHDCTNDSAGERAIQCVTQSDKYRNEDMANAGLLPVHPQLDHDQSRTDIGRAADQ